MQDLNVRSVLLNVSTEYSFGKALGRMTDVIARLQDLGVTHAGIVDTSTYGHVKWDMLCKQAGITPLFGAKVIVTEQKELYGEPPYMWFLAASQAGLQDMYRLMSLAHDNKICVNNKELEPSLYPSDLEGISNDLLIFTGSCVSADVLKGIAAHSSSFVDISTHDPIEIQALKKELANTYGLPYLTTAGNSYISQQDKALYQTVFNTGPLRYDQHIVPYADDAESRNIITYIAHRCAGVSLPRAVPMQLDGDLRAMCMRNAPALVSAWDSRYQDRLDYELSIITSKGFQSYFILVHDLVDYARSQHIRLGPARGSAAGSLVCYLLRITYLDPIRAGLLFERFLDQGRDDLPDIDIDVQSSRRFELVRYLQDTYASVAKVGNVSTYTEKTVDYLLEEDNKAMLGASIMRLYGHANRPGTHASGLLISDTPLSGYCAINDCCVAQVDKGDIDALGLLKLDLLGLRTLDLLDSIPEAKGIDYDQIPLNDDATYKLIGEGYTQGIFQLEGAAVAALCKRKPPRSIDELALVIALARSGPIKAGITMRYINHAHKSGIFRGGMMYFQEDTMLLVKELGGFSASECNMIRRYISKAHAADITPLRDKFMANATRAVGPAKAQDLWLAILNLGEWSMCKAHAYGYALLAYYSAYFKAHYLESYTAAALNHTKGHDHTCAILREYLQLADTEWCYFHPMLSQANWSAQGGILYAGLNNIKHFMQADIAAYLDRRRQGALNAAEIEAIKARGFNYTNESLFPLLHQYAHLNVTTLFMASKSDTPVSCIGVIDNVELTQDRRSYKLVLHDDRSKVVSFVPDWLLSASKLRYSDLMRGRVLYLQGKRAPLSHYFVINDRISISKLEILA